MKTSLIYLLFISVALVSCSEPPQPKKTEVKLNSQSPKVLVGEKAIPTVEGNLIKVNNKLCAVSRGLMAEETLGTFTGQVAYEGSNPRYQGKTFEFNYCCGMCQNMFPEKFKKDPDGILRFHGLI